MTSTSRLPESPVRDRAPGSETADQSERWRLKPAAADPTGVVDGGWWPRSNDLAAEIPELLAAVAPRVGRVERVTYRIGEWAPVGRRITVDGGVVRFGGFHSQPANTVDLVSRTQRLSVLVVPSSTDPAEAEQAMAKAADGGDVDDVPALSAASSHPVSTG